MGESLSDQINRVDTAIPVLQITVEKEPLIGEEPLSFKEFRCLQPSSVRGFTYFLTGQIDNKRIPSEMSELHSHRIMHSRSVSIAVQL